MLIKNNIMYQNKNILILTNDIELYNYFKLEYKNYFIFTENINNKNKIILKVFKDKKLYEKYFKKVRQKQYNKKDIYIDIRRENIIFIDKIQKEISLIYNYYDDSKLQQVEEIVCGIFGKLIENDKYFFINAACISKNEKGILILDDGNSEKISLLLQCIQSKFDFVSNNLIAINKNIGISIPTRIGININTLEDGTIKEEYKKNIKETSGYKCFLENYNDNSKKFNITLSDVNNIFKINTISKSRIKLIIYLQNLSSVKKEKLQTEDIVQLFFRNKKSSIYAPVQYIDKLFDKNTINDTLSEIIKTSDNIKGYRLNKKMFSNIEILDFIKNEIEEN